jgi:AcrR family transcriptional regulator
VGRPPATDSAETRRRILAGARTCFGRYGYDKTTNKDIASAAGITAGAIYHYFPSKTQLFKAAVAEKAAELASVIEPSHEGSPVEQLADSLDAYLGWIENNAQTWSKLMQSAATLDEVRELVESFRERTLELVLEELSEGRKVRPALRTAVKGWLGFMDAAILDWAPARDIPRSKLRDLLLAVFAGALMAAQQADPRVRLRLGPPAAD